MKRPKNDQLILRLLKAGDIVVSEDHDDLIYDKSFRTWQPRTVITVRSQRYRHRMMPAIYHPNKVGFPRFRVCLMEDGAKPRHIWLSPNRVIWLAFGHKPGSYNVGFFDGDPWNFSIWNLREVADQGEQNYHRMLAEGRPEEEAEPADPDDVPF